ncbi:MAG: flagellar motor protein PomA [Gammaproteobacteria bacterium]|nr:flagellar motor protein PomA [Gammaproteobacteria bacterium]
MDLATIIGMLAMWGVMIGAILVGPSAIMFVNPPSLMIVVGGTLFVIMMKYDMKQFIGAFGTAGKTFTNKVPNPLELMEKLQELANISRKDGLLALEGAEIDYDFLKKGVQMMVDGHAPEMISSVLKKDMAMTVERHAVGVDIFKGYATYAPAMGMIGTLIGLVQMLANMSDPASIGPAMAVALLTTLYGAMIANMLCQPIAEKLSLRSNEEKIIKSMVIDGLQSIQAGHNPRVIQELLSTYISASKRPVDEE